MALPKICSYTPEYLIEPINYAIENMIDRDFIEKFRTHRGNSMRRNISFEFTFKEWYEWWTTNNRWENRGVGTGKFVMARLNDEGPYSVDNVYCATHQQNIKDIPKANKKIGFSKAQNTKQERLAKGDDPFLHLRRGKHPRARRIMTPKGEFCSATTASIHYGFSREWARKQLKQKKPGWYYL